MPILILSSRTDEAGIVQALELGADDYITKPFGMKEVIARLRVAIRHRSSSRANGRCSGSANSTSISCGAS